MSTGRIICAATTVFLVATASVAHAETATPYADIRPWTIVKRPDGTCYAVARDYAMGQDYYFLSSDLNLWSLTLGNERFNIPPGPYPVGLSIGGTQVFPSVDETATGVVQEGRN